MPTKPYSLQSPEQIAKDYAGNKQKIAQAAQSGLLDPTAAVMAGMFIDRMRSAQTQEQGPPSTVAQQVFAPPPPPMQMGAMPSSAPMGAPRPPMGAPQGAPPPPMGAPPVGMAGGGLTTLPLPDNMFNEPDGMGYANGGIVAFAGGGGGEVYRMGDGYVYADGSPAPAPEPGSTVQRGAQRLIGSGIVGSGRGFNVPVAPAPDDKPGVMIPPPRGLPSTEMMAAMEPRPAAPSARPAAPRPAAPARPAPTPASASLLAAGVVPRVGGPAPAAPRAGVTPIAAPRPGVPAGPALPASPASPASPAAPGVPGAPRTLGGVPADVAAIMAQGREMAPQSTAATDAMRDYYQRMSSPEALAAQKKQDMWATLAQIGFGMAGSNSPSFLQAAGQSASAAMPGMMQANRDRKAQEAASVRGMYDIETATNKANTDLYQYSQQLAVAVDKGIISQEQADREIDLKEKQVNELIRSNLADESIKKSAINARGSGSGRTPKETDSRYWARRRVEANAGDPAAKAEVAAYDQGRSRGGGNPYQRGAAPVASTSSSNWGKARVVGGG